MRLEFDADDTAVYESAGTKVVRVIEQVDENNLPGEFKITKIGRSNEKICNSEVQSVNCENHCY